MDNGNWCLIESDPGVFGELIAQFGVEGVAVDEVWSLDQLSSSQEQIYGLVFLFNLTAATPSRSSTSPLDGSADDGLFFAHQVINNACATQAILHVLLNSRDKLKLGRTLDDFLEFSQQLPPDMRGLAISNSEHLRSVHNSFARPEVFVSDGRKATKKDDLFHFVSFVPCVKNGHLYELDGLQESPIDHGPIPAGSSWLDKAQTVLAGRMQEFSGGEIRFNLLSVMADPRVRLMQTLSNPDIDELTRSEAATQLEREEEKRARVLKENARRRHNFIPLIFKMLEMMAKKGALDKF